MSECCHFATHIPSRSPLTFRPATESVGCCWDDGGAYAVIVFSMALLKENEGKGKEARNGAHKCLVSVGSLSQLLARVIMVPAEPSP
jgi:hypothetical protein